MVLTTKGLELYMNKQPRESPIDMSTKQLEKESLETLIQDNSKWWQIDLKLTNTMVLLGIMEN